MPIQLPIINIRINEHLPKNKIYLIDMADNVVGIIEMEPKRVTTDIYISMGYYVEELLIDGTQHVIIRKATRKELVDGSIRHIAKTYNDIIRSETVPFKWNQPITGVPLTLERINQGFEKMKQS